MRRFGMALAGLALLVPACGMVPDDAYAQAPPGQDCSAAEHRQFDFWIAEHWESAKGGHGAFADGRMVLSSEPNKAGAFDRITWSAQPDGSVRQAWQQTTDGRTWRTAFDGRYVRRKSS
jgi:hypothetical protein